MTTEEIAPMSDAERKAAATVLAERASVIETAAKAMEAAKSKARKELEPELEGLRVFLCPQHPNTTFLVKAGTMVSFRDQNAPLGERHVRRDGDVMAVFSGGVCATNDDEVIGWCEAHGPDEGTHRAYHRTKGTNARTCAAKTGLCIDASHPMAEMWVDLKAGQIPLMGRDATLPKGMEVDKVLTGGMPTTRIGGEGSRMTDAAKSIRKTGRATAERE